MDELTGIALGHVNRLGRQAVNYAQEIDRANGEVRKANAYIDQLHKRIAELELALAVESAHAEGYKAMFSGMKTQHPTSPLLADSGRRYKNGTVKTKVALSYEAAFDRIFAAARIPGTKATDHRAD